MALEQHEDDLMRCTRCSYCKWVPHQVMQDSRFLTGCPSIERFKPSPTLRRCRAVSVRLPAGLGAAHGQGIRPDA
jgi:hypothetical protein